MKVNSGTILLAFFAVVAGLIGVHFYREANRPKPVAAPAAVVKTAPRTMVVPMVSRTLKPGQTVTKDDVALVKLTREQMNDNGLTKKAFMSQPDQIIGKTVKRELRRGNTFDTRDFYPVGQGPGIVGRVKPGQRAITIGMLPTNALLGFAGAGQKVDVLFHYGQQGDDSNNSPLTSAADRRSRNSRRYANIPIELQAATSTLIQGAEILAFNQQTIPIEETKGLPMDRRVLVTLSVYPREAELLRMASGHGELSLTLRSPGDKENVPTVTPRTLDEIIDVRSNRQTMEIYRGNRVSRLEFQGGTVIKRTINSGKRNQLGGSGSGSKNAILVSQTTKVANPESESAESLTRSDYREIPQMEIEDGDPFLVAPISDPSEEEAIETFPAGGQ